MQILQNIRELGGYILKNVEKQVGSGWRSYLAIILAAMALLVLVPVFWPEEEGTITIFAALPRIVAKAEAIPTENTCLKYLTVKYFGFSDTDATIYGSPIYTMKNVSARLYIIVTT